MMKGFYIPNNLLNDDASSRNIQHITQPISTISSVASLRVIGEVDSVIDELNKQIDSEILQQSNKNTGISYYLGKVYS